MHLKLKRLDYGAVTIGELFIDDEFECFTLEDQVRETGQPVESWKIPGNTAIPRGLYKITLDYSVRFRQTMPRLLDVEGFRGVRIHPGNTIHDTEGCILVGTAVNKNVLVASLDAYNKLYKKLKLAYHIGDQILISID
ncbi:MAG TPA: DUF5675 family protein [Nitrosomonas sp.]|nr:DUF5675 family protein [Nitrosomonas sp.]